MLHPVVWIGRAISLLERIAHAWPGWPRFIYGAWMTPGVVGRQPHSAGAVARASGSALPGPIGVFAGGMAAEDDIQRPQPDRGRPRRSRHVLHMQRSGGGPPVSQSAGQPRYHSLDERLLASAAVESLAENTADSIVAPLLATPLGGLPAALAYRAINTLDAMIGYHGQYEYLGKAAAHLDDLANLLPARLLRWLLVVGGALAGGDVALGVRTVTLRRPRPNGQPERWLADERDGGPARRQAREAGPLRPRRSVARAGSARHRPRCRDRQGRRRC